MEGFSFLSLFWYKMKFTGDGQYSSWTYELPTGHHHCLRFDNANTKINNNN